MIQITPGSTTVTLSLNELEQVIKSEIQRLIDIRAKTLSVTLHHALTQLQNTAIDELNAELNTAGRTGTASPRPTQLGPLLRAMPIRELENYCKYGPYFREYTHIQLVNSLEAFLYFMDQEARYLIESKAQNISPDYFRALQKYQTLVIFEITIRLEIAADQHILPENGLSDSDSDSDIPQPPPYSDVDSLDSWQDEDTIPMLGLNRYGIFLPSPPIPIPPSSTKASPCPCIEEISMGDQRESNAPTDYDEHSFSFSLAFK